MDTFKRGTYLDVPESLEKGPSEIEPLYSEADRASSVQPARTRSRRSWIVFGAVALTWVVFSCRNHIFNRPRHAWHWAADSMDLAPPGDRIVDQCAEHANWTYYDEPPWTPEYPYGAETTLTLPVDSYALYLLSRGAFQHGHVDIEQSTKVADTVDVRVRAAYYHDKALEFASVCRLEREDNEYGVGIFTPPQKVPHRVPHRYRPKEHIRFDVTVTLPAGDHGHLLVRKLETQMPDYSQSVADLRESVLFNSISLSSANGKLSVESVTSEVGRFSSLNGEIEGKFTARSSLDLHTANGLIAPVVNLLHSKGAEPASLNIRAVNGQIDAEVSLTSETSVGGEFEVGVETTNGEIGLKFVDSPVDSVLRCQVETTVGGISVELDSAFEGTYSLQTLLGKKLVIEHDVEDPAGRGRHRVVSQHDAAGRLEGELKWVERDGSSSGKEGYVILKSVVPSVQLVV